MQPRGLRAGGTGWPLSVLAEELTEASFMDALRRGPYGRCVYRCDNDVVDHQVVNLRFKGGATAAFTMTAFTEAGPRRTGIFGTRGEIRGDGRRLRVFDFLTDEERVVDTVESDGSIATGHGGGDDGVMAAFLGAVSTGDDSGILSGARATLASHLMVFAAECARREDRVVRMEEYGMG